MNVIIHLNLKTEAFRLHGPGRVRSELKRALDAAAGWLGEPRRGPGDFSRLVDSNSEELGTITIADEEERIHPRSYAEIHQLVKLHGAARVIAAVLAVEGGS